MEFILIISYVIFGFITVSFPLINTKNQIDSSSLFYKLLYFHGVGFVIGFIAVSVLVIIIELAEYLLNLKL